MLLEKTDESSMLCTVSVSKTVMKCDHSQSGIIVKKHSLIREWDEVMKYFANTSTIQNEKLSIFRKTTK
jgi:hypothetical protein